MSPNFFYSYAVHPHLTLWCRMRTQDCGIFPTMLFLKVTRRGFTHGAVLPSFWAFPLLLEDHLLPGRDSWPPPWGPLSFQQALVAAAPVPNPCSHHPTHLHPKTITEVPPLPLWAEPREGSGAAASSPPPSNLPLDVWSLINPPCTPRRAQCLPVRARFLLVFQLLAKAPAHTCCALGLEAVISEALDFLLM